MSLIFELRLRAVHPQCGSVLFGWPWYLPLIALMWLAWQSLDGEAPQPRRATLRHHGTADRDLSPFTRLSIVASTFTVLSIVKPALDM